MDGLWLRVLSQKSRSTAACLRSPAESSVDGWRCSRRSIHCRRNRAIPFDRGFTRELCGAVQVVATGMQTRLCGYLSRLVEPTTEWLRPSMLPLSSGSRHTSVPVRDIRTLMMPRAGRSLPASPGSLRCGDRCPPTG